MKWGIVVGGGVEDYLRLFEQLKGMDHLIACDSGARHLEKLGLIPDLLVGDMDSISQTLLESWKGKGVPTLRFRPEKDETDSELAVSMALEKGATEISLFANGGNRLDHLMANISLLYRIRRAGVRGMVHTDTQDIWLIEGEESLEGPIGQTVSFIPMGLEAKGVTLKGFQYPLNEYDYQQGTPIGISNRIEAPPCTVTVREGILVAIRTWGPV